MKRRVLALVHDHLVPPRQTKGVDVREAEWKMEFDVIETLREMGHQVRVRGVHDDLSGIRPTVASFTPHIVFNLLEAFAGVATFDQNVVSYLELLRLPYTGCNPRGLILARDKALSKQLLALHRVPVPGFTVVRPGRKPVLPRRLGYPLIVKSLFYESSIGISQASVVENDEQLAKRVTFVHEHLGMAAIVEQFIDGRELYVGVLGNERLEVFPVVGDVVCGDGGQPLAHRNRAREVEHAVSEAPQHHDEPRRAARGHGRCHRPHRQTQLPRVGPQRLRAHRHPARRRRPPICDRREPQPEPGLRRGLRGVGRARRHSYERLLERIIGLGLRWEPARTARSARSEAIT